MSGTPKLTRLLPPSAMRRPLKENSTQAPCVRLTTLFSRAPKADCPTRAPSAHFFRASKLWGVSLQLGKNLYFLKPFLALLETIFRSHEIKLYLFLPKPKQKKKLISFDRRIYSRWLFVIFKSNLAKIILLSKATYFWS